MADGRRQADWQRTSLLAALIHNQHAGKRNAKQPRDFDPYQRRRKSGRLTAATIGRLKAFLPDKGDDKAPHEPKRNQSRPGLRRIGHKK